MFTRSCPTCGQIVIHKHRDSWNRAKKSNKPCGPCRGIGNPEARFWAKVHRGPDCWEWTAATRGPINQEGKNYGQFWDGKHLIGAHRFSYILAFGEIPDGLSVLHKCDNPPCIRPDHLFLGTIGDNNLDAQSKGRGYQLPPRIGELNRAKLTVTDILAIRSELGENVIRGDYARLGRKYGVTKENISAIHKRKTWTHI